MARLSHSHSWPFSTRSYLVEVTPSAWAGYSRAATRLNIAVSRQGPIASVVNCEEGIRMTSPTDDELWTFVTDRRNGILATIDQSDTPQLSNV